MKYRHPVLVVCVAAVLAATCVVSAQAQGRPGSQRGGFGRGGFRPGGGMMRGAPGELALLMRPDVRKELVLLDDQVEQLQELTGELDMRGMFEQLRDVPQDQRREKMREMVEQAREKRRQVEQKVKDILLPHQVTRLNQLARQLAMQRSGRVLVAGVADELDISDQQIDQLREKARKLEAEMRKKMMQQLIDELSADQQAKLKELIGEPFAFEPQSPRGPGRGAPRGRGDRPRRGRRGGN